MSDSLTRPCAPNHLHLPDPLADSSATVRPWIEPAIWGFIALGLLVRVARYLLQFPLWGDECFLAVNFTTRGYGELIGPLDYNMVAPPLFCWAELTAVRLFGFHELSLRLVPMLASAASVFVFAHLARKLLTGIPLLLAVAVFCVSYYPVRHGCEVKPYAIDLLATLVILTLAVDWLAQPSHRKIILLTLAVPIAVGFSMPVVFVAGAVGLVLFFVALQRRRGDLPLVVGLYGGVLLASFAAMYLTVGRGQAEAYEAAGLKSCWAPDFPPVDQPLELFVWLIDRHTSHMFAYPVGGSGGGSTLTAIAIALAAGLLWRRRQIALLGLMFFPLVLCFVAAAMEQYPYGGSQRTMQFVAPMACLLSIIGTVQGIAWMRGKRWRHGVVYALGAYYVLLALATLGDDLAHPYKTIYDQRSDQFAHWFWEEFGREGQLACIHDDLGLEFDPQHWTFDRTAVYRCQREMYSSRHRAKEPADLSAVTRDYPLRCVFYNELPLDDPRFRDWLDDMQDRFLLSDRQTYRVNFDPDQEGYEDEYVVYEFVPQDSSGQRDVEHTARR